MRKGRTIVFFILIFIIYNSLLLTTTSTRQSLMLQQDRTIKVLLIRSIDDFSDSLLSVIESEFTENYETYGHTKIIIDSSTVALNPISSELFSETQADVLYLHNIGGHSVDEQNAIISYVSNGHGIIGTHGTLQQSLHSPLASLFGINPDMVSNGGMNNFPTSSTMNINDSSHPLLANMSSPYFVQTTTTAAVNGQQSPWSDDPRILLENGTLLATSTDGNVAIIYSEGENTRSVYLTNNPGESQSTNDLKLLYNSLSWSSLVSNQLIHGTSSGPTTTPDSSEQTTTPDILTVEILTIIIILSALIGGIYFVMRSQRKTYGEVKISKVAQAPSQIEDVSKSLTDPTEEKLITSTVRMCTSCNEKNDLEGFFCGNCGTKL